MYEKRAVRPLLGKAVHAERHCSDAVVRLALRFNLFYIFADSRAGRASGSRERAWAAIGCKKTRWRAYKAVGTCEDKRRLLDVR